MVLVSFRFLMNVSLVWVYVIILTMSSVTKAFIPDLYFVVFLVTGFSFRVLYSGPRELYYYP